MAKPSTSLSKSKPPAVQESAKTVEQVDNDTGEVTVVAAVPSASLSQMAQQTTVIGGKTYKLARKVTLPLLKQKENEIVTVKILTAMKEGKKIEKGDAAQRAMPPAILCNVLDLADMGEKQYIIPAVLKGVFEDEFPNDTYVGKSFAILAMPKETGKRYKPFAVNEIIEA